jgi:hypothetical protein
MRAREGFTGDEFKRYFASRRILKDQFVLIICKKMRCWSGKYLRFV